IRGCNQLKELSHNFQNVNWIMSTLREIKTFDGSNSKIRCLKHINEKPHSFSESAKGWNSYLDESSEPGVQRDSSSKLLGQSLCTHSKLLDARKRSNLLSRDVHMKRWLYRKSDTSYKRVEEFLDFSLKDIMKENNFDFFVAEIESRVKNGYYLGYDLSSVKEDISRMCRDLEYLDLYLIHWPLSSKPGKYEYPIPKEELLLMNFKSVWKAMEE
ncbi:hypothetical protein GIB67_042421, partial [Kingdonia uniflora]